MGLSFPLGLGILTLFLYLINIFGIKITLHVVLLITVIFAVPLFILFRKKISGFVKESIKKLQGLHLTNIEKVILLATGFLIFSSFLNTSFWPVRHWDALTLYDFRGKVIAQTGEIKSVIFDSYYVEYPLLTSLAHTVAYLTGSSNPKFIYSIYYLSLGLVFYGLLKRFLDRNISLLFTLLLISIPIFYEHSVNSYTNLPYTFYFSLSAIYLFISDLKNNRRLLFLSALLLGLSTWTRSIEPFWLGMVFAVFILSLIRKRILNILFYLLAFLPIQQAWRMFQNIYGTRGTTVSELSGYFDTLKYFFDWQRWGTVLTFFYDYFLKPYGAVFVIFILCVFVAFSGKSRNKMWPIFFITLIFLALIFAGTFLNSILLTSGCFLGCGDAATRVGMLMYPLFIYCTALTLGKISR